MTALTAPQFTNEAAAIAHLEASRWPDGSTARIAVRSTFTAWAAKHRPECSFATIAATSSPAAPARSWSARKSRFTSGCWRSISCPRPRRACRRTSCTVCSASPTSRLGFLRIASAKRWHGQKPRRWAAMAVRCRPTKPITATRRSVRSATGRANRKEAVLGRLVDPETGEARAFHMELGAGVRCRSRILVKQRHPQVHFGHRRKPSLYTNRQGICRTTKPCCTAATST